MLKKLGLRLNCKSGKTAKESEDTTSKSLLCQSQGPARESCILTSGIVTFGWIHQNILNPQMSMKLLPEAPILSPLLERKIHNGWKLYKNLTWVSCFVRQCFFCLRYATTTFTASGITSVYWEKTFPTLGGNSLYNQNNHRTRIIKAGKKCKSTCGSVSRECSIDRGSGKEQRI